eukprot:scaffold909_cov132-Skeletonema_marinoi.AAC.2
MSGCVCILSERNPIQSIVLSVVLNNALPVDMSTKSQITSLLLHYTQKYLSAILITITLQHIGNLGMIFLPGVLK